MKLRRLILMLASIALAFVLIVLLVKVGKVDLRVTLQQLKSVTLIAFAKIVLLNAFLVYLSTEKWRSIDAAWRRPSDSIQPKITSYAVTSVGLAMGVFLPLQLAMATARTLGTYIHGRALKRGTAGTLLEQGFDVYTVAFLALASGITWFYHGGAKTWALCASASIVLALLAVGPSVFLVRWLFASCSALSAEPHNRILRSFWAIQHSGILNAGLARRLVALSALRTGTVVLMSIQTAEAVGLHIPPWQMAAAVPLVSVAAIIALTPGGIGLNDLAGAGALRIFGTPFAIGAQWVLANRVLVSVSYLLVAFFAIVVLCSDKVLAHYIGGAIREDNQ
jgi:uncharacterized membrane protein YbhN (UPF0104 family)